MFIKAWLEGGRGKRREGGRMEILSCTLHMHNAASGYDDMQPVKKCPEWTRNWELCTVFVNPWSLDVAPLVSGLMEGGNGRNQCL